MKSKGQRATKKGATALGNRLAVPQKVKIALPCGSAIPLLGIPKGHDNIHSGKNLYVNVHASIIHK